MASIEIAMVKLIYADIFPDLLHLQSFKGQYSHNLSPASNDLQPVKAASIAERKWLSLPF